MHCLPLCLQNTFEVHWGKHHRTYVNNLNNQIQGKDLESKSLEEVLHTWPLFELFDDDLKCDQVSLSLHRPGLCLQVVKATWNNGSPSPEFNNAAQAWNHKFFWHCMKAGGGGASCSNCLPASAMAITLDIPLQLLILLETFLKQADCISLTVLLR